MSTTPYADTLEGRLLIALRAGELSSEALYVRIGGESYAQRTASKAIKSGLIERRAIEHEWIYRLTPAGRALCPTRRDLVGWIPAEVKHDMEAAEA